MHLRGFFMHDHYRYEIIFSTFASAKRKQNRIILIIRTGGEQRLSNFLLWQGAYSELYFTPTYWPDFSGDDFDAAVAAYSGRHRRFGKVDEQE